MAAATARPLKRRKGLSMAILLAATLAVILLILFVRQNAPPDPKSAFAGGELVVGVDASFPPFALDDGESIQGLDIDLASAIAHELNLPVRFKNIGFYALHDALKSGQVDLLISALRVDPARMDDLRYTQSYFDNGLVIVTAADSPEANIISQANTRVAFEYASSADSQIRMWEEDGQSVQRRPYELPDYALDALQLGLADAAIVDATTLRLYQSSHSEWTARHQYITHEPYAIALRIDRVDAWRLVDGALETLIESGELAIIIDKWL